MAYKPQINRAALLPAFYAAIAFTLPQSLRLMTRSDSIYIPGIVEIPLLAISFVAFGLVSVVIATPLAAVARAKLSHPRADAMFALALSIGGSVALYALGIFSRSSIFDSVYFWGSFVPLFVLGFAAFRLASGPHTGSQG